MKNSSRIQLISMVVLFIIFLASFGNLTAQSNNWPQFRGQNASGLANDGSNPPVEFGPNQNLLWKIPLPEGHSSPCIWDNNLFLTAFIKDQKELQTICINRNTGEIKWRQAIHPENIEDHHAIGNPATSTPTTDGEQVYVYFGSYGLLCYELDGTLVWEKKILVKDDWFGAATSPIAAEDVLILSHDLNENSYLLAIDKTSGDIVWKVMLPKMREEDASTSSYSTPLIVNNQVILHRYWEISAYSVKDGSRLWWLPTPTFGVSTPIFYQHTLYIGTWTFAEKDRQNVLPDHKTLIAHNDNNNDGLITQDEIPNDMPLFDRPEMKGHAIQVKDHMELFDKNKDGSIDEEEWIKSVELITTLYGDSGLMALKFSGKGELPISQVLWKEKDEVPEVPTPIYYNGCVYMIKNGGIITCVDAESGKIYYRERLGASGPYFASPIVAGGNLYIPSGKGVITVIKAGKSLDVLARNKLKERVLATPAVVENTLYVRTAQHLYAFGQ